MTVRNQGIRPDRMQPPNNRPGQSEVEHPAEDGDPRHVPDARPAMTDVQRRGQHDTIRSGSLPPIGLLLARPLLLLVCAVVGGIVGFGLAGNGGYRATAVLEFNSASADSLRVKQTGQTLARTASSRQVLDAAGAATGADLTDRVSASWEEDTRLIAVTVTADSPEAAVTDANAFALAIVQTSEASIRDLLNAARDESNQLLDAQQLDSPDAEAARRSQLGDSLGARQDAISSESSRLTVSDPASTATVSGLTKSMGVAIGLTVGLLLGGLLSLLLGVRGLRAYSERTLSQLVPFAKLSSPSEAAQLAGRAIESGKSCLAVIFMEGAQAQSADLAADITDFVRAHGRVVARIGPIEKADRKAAFDMLRRDARDDVRHREGVDLLVVVVPADSDASALLEGQSNLQALVVMRRRRTRISSVLRVMKAFVRADPILILAR